MSQLLFTLLIYSHRLTQFTFTLEYLVILKTTWKFSFLRDSLSSETPVCSVYIPTFQPPSYDPFQEIYLHEVAHWYFEKMSTWSSSLPGLLLLPISASPYSDSDSMSGNDNPILPIMSDHTRFTTLKILVLHESSDSAYIPCLPCESSSEWDVSLRRQLSIPVTLKDLHVRWENLHSNLHSNYPYDEWYDNTPSSHDYTKSIIFQSLNCSGERCTRLYKEPFMFTSSIWTMRKAKHSISAGAISYGYKYRVFISQDTLYQQTDMLFLLNSLSGSEWSYIIVGLGLVIGILYISGIKESTFWVVTTIFEPGDLLSDHVNSKNAHIILGWIFTTILVRNIYQIRMFAVLTAGPVPKDMPPTSFQDLIQNNTMTIVGEQALQEFLYDARVSRRAYNFTLGNKTDNLLDEKSIIISFEYRGLVNVFRKLSQGIKVACLKYVIKDSHIPQDKAMGPPFSEYPEGAGKYIGERMKALKIFAFIYRTLPVDDSVIKDTRGVSDSNFYLSPLIDAFGNRKLFANIESEVLMDFRLWYSSFRVFCIPFFESRLANLVKSGIDARIRTIFQNRNHAFNMKTVNRDGRFNRRWNFETLSYNPKLLSKRFGAESEDGAAVS
ncbi:unnamed protein product [Orchesella dallaii]|uniref:Uncharacterized protein n=1 Tax=Orchesella dallaii TaxID=48710 RepID=A0ABP1S314_9HEXA